MKRREITRLEQKFKAEKKMIDEVYSGTEFGSGLNKSLFMQSQIIDDIIRSLKQLKQHK